MIKILLLGLSASMDSWAIGAAYQAEDIRIPRLTKIIVSIISGITSLAAVLLGNYLGKFIDTRWIQMAGGMVLFVIGAKSLWGVWTQRGEPNCDSDASKSIEPLEGVILGAVLASDSFCAGLSLCAMGAKGYVFPVVVGIFTYFFLMLADKKVKYQGAFDYVAGAALAGIGIWQVIEGIGLSYLQNGCVSI